MLRVDQAHNPQLKNIYFELGNTFNQASMFAPVVGMHILGQMLQTVGPERILWGTDSVWTGSPQSQIVRFRRFQIHPSLIERYKYPELTDEIKAKILGLNTARLFDIDVKARREAIKADYLTQLREQGSELFKPTNTQYGWVWEGEGRSHTLPVGA